LNVPVCVNWKNCDSAPGEISTSIDGPDVKVTVWLF